jgi:hypothetical protein
MDHGNDGLSGVEPHSFDDRHAERTPVLARTVLQHPDRYVVEVTIRNVSSRGFMAECPEQVAIGSYVSLDIPGIGPVHAQVRWQLAGRMGGMFVDPLSLHPCEWQAIPAEEAA